MRYEPRAHETDAGPVCSPVCSDCLHFCSFGTRLYEPCDRDWCVCELCTPRRRAAELDDRPAAALENLARDMERERVPTLDELRAERYGPRPRRA